MSSPKAQARPQNKVIILASNLPTKDYSSHVRQIEMEAHMNGGYIVRVVLFDPQCSIHDSLIKDGYFKHAQREPMIMNFQMKAGPDGEFPETATRVQTAYIVSMKASGGAPDKATIEFIAIDPPSWFLNIGDADGSCYRGRMDQVIKKVVQKYAPKIKLDIGKTRGSEEMPWWMMRLDPQTFIASLLEWSSAVTPQRTNLMIGIDGTDMEIKEQASMVSKQRGFYRYMDTKDHDTITDWEYLADNALSLIQHKLVTHGLSAISGQYLDKITDEKEKKVFVKDENTSTKQIPKLKDDQAFSKPSSGSLPTVGWSAVRSIPEMYSAGDIGIPYSDYIDGCARNIWLNSTNRLQQVCFTVLGHGEWSDSKGLGADTIFVRWTKAKTDDSDNRYWWMTGNWLVTGFKHTSDRKGWYTQLFCSRYNWDSQGKKVGGSQ